MLDEILEGGDINLSDEEKRKEPEDIGDKADPCGFIPMIIYLAALMLAFLLIAFGKYSSPTFIYNPQEYIDKINAKIDNSIDSSLLIVKARMAKDRTVDSIGR